MARNTTVALLGGGIMAQEIGPRLHSAGLGVNLFNRTPAKWADRADQSGFQLCHTPADAARGADAVLSFVFDDAASQDVWFGPAGAAFGAAEGTIAVECSTLSVAGAEGWAQAAIGHRLSPIHAPVTGSRSGASTGKLVVFAGADELTVRKTDWLFDLFAQEVVPCGTAAAAAGFKLANNLFASTVLVGLAETLTLAAGIGVDVPQLVDVLSRHGWGTKVADSKGVDMAASAYGDVMCALRTINKDVGYALTAAETAGVSIPVAARMARQWERGEQLGVGDLDMAAIKRVYD